LTLPSVWYNSNGWLIQNHFTVAQPGRDTAVHAIEHADYYKTLGVDRTADDRTITQAYRRPPRKYYPDVNKARGATEASRKSTRPARSSLTHLHVEMPLMGKEK
jgi:hypothetical protein